MAFAKSFSYNVDRTPKRVGLLVALALHAAVIVVLLAYPPLRSAVATAMPIMVSLITPPKVETPPEPPKPRPVKPQALPKPIELPPLLTATPVNDAPASFTALPAPVQPAPFEPAPPQPAAPAPIIPPRFNADYLDNPPPPYPPLARRMGEQGKVLLRVLVNATGTADRVEVKASSGFTRLDEIARDTVRRWRFVPAKQGTQAVSAWVLIPISFTLEG